MRLHRSVTDIFHSPFFFCHLLVHTSLDVVEEKIATGSKNASDSRELYLGLLYPTEDYKVYGYVTNTKVQAWSLVSALFFGRDTDAIYTL